MKIALICFISRNYRRFEALMLAHQVPVFTPAFRVFLINGGLLSGRKLTRLKRFEDDRWKQRYFRHHDESRPCFNIEADYPASLPGADHVDCLSTFYESSANPKFMIVAWEVLDGVSYSALNIRVDWIYRHLKVGCFIGSVDFIADHNSLIRAICHSRHASSGLVGEVVRSSETYSRQEPRC